MTRLHNQMTALADIMSSGAATVPSSAQETSNGSDTLQGQIITEEPTRELLLRIVRLLDELPGEVLDEVVLSPVIQRHYQIHRLVPVRRGDKVETRVGPLLRRAAEDDEETQTPQPVAKRARIQSNEHVEELEEAEEVNEDALENTDDEEDTEETPGNATTEMEETAMQGMGIVVDPAVDEVPVVPSTAMGSGPLPAHEWFETPQPLLPAMTLLRRNHPTVHEALHKALASNTTKISEVGSRICTLADALASPQSVCEVSDDLGRALRLACWTSNVGAHGEYFGLLAGQLSLPASQDQGFSGGLAGQLSLPASQDQGFSGGLVTEDNPGQAAATMSFADRLTTLLGQKDLPGVYQRVQQLDAGRYLNGLLLRVHLTHLAELFEQRLAAGKLSEANRSTELGPRQRVSLIKDLLFKELVDGGDRRSPKWSSEARRFERRLDLGRRWLALVQRFGWGSLVMVPANFPESRLLRDIGSADMMDLFLDHVTLRFPQWFAAERAISILVGLLSEERPQQLPNEARELNLWITGKE
jgi:hypothetical protein